MKLTESLIEFIVIQCQVVIIYSVLLKKNINRGRRLMINENLIDVVAYSGKLICLIELVIEIRIGDKSIIRIRKIEVEIVFITFIWICTKIFGS